MKCPHCSIAIHPKIEYRGLGSGIDGNWELQTFFCPACQKLVMLIKDTREAESIPQLVWPKSTARPPCPAQVPKDIAEDYYEACMVIADSPKASAALSRRALQHLLSTAAGATEKDLVKQIQRVLKTGNLPSHISESIDAIRIIGNFSAHPQKSQQTGEILPVELHEAEWNLDVLEDLFDFYYVQPDLIKKKRDALNQKLAEAGKPPMK